jgi:sphingomyelin phosphodiesterase acid-like 3
MTILAVSRVESDTCSYHRPPSSESKRLVARITPGGKAVFPLLSAILAVTSALAQTAAPVPTIPALFLSDIHFDPYADPAKVAKLNASPASDWVALLATPDSPTRAADTAALSKACPTRGLDTNAALFRSSLAALHANASHSTFVTLSGDLLAHSFDCKYKILLPESTHAGYLSFVEKTIRYEISSLRKALPGVPIYVAMGNNDSGCTDYALDPTHDEFLALTAKIVAEALPAPDRAAVLRDFTLGGYYNVPLAHVPNTRLVVLDDVYLSSSYITCAGKPDPAPAAAQLAWLQTQLTEARNLHQRVWVLAHIPPGVNLYASARSLLTLCEGSQPNLFLSSEKLAEVLAANADVVRLALFGHTHSDEIRLLLPERPTDNDQRSTPPLGVPVKIVASITPVNGNNPSFTLATIDPATATLADYTVIAASNPLRDDTTQWGPSYTYSAAYHQRAFDSAALLSLISALQADPGATTPASQAYLQNYAPGEPSPILQLAWPQYTCSLNHDSAAAFTACSCAAAPASPQAGIP